MDVPPELVVEGAFSREGGYRDVSRLLEVDRSIDCVFAVTDVMAVGAMAGLRREGLEPGTDVGVAGFDDIAMLADVTPSLTTVALPLATIGARAVDLALAAEGELPAVDRRISGELQLRESTPRRT